MDWMPMETMGASVPFLISLARKHRLNVAPGSPLAGAIELIERARQGARDAAVVPFTSGESRGDYAARISKLLVSAYAADFATKAIHRGHLAGLAVDRIWLRHLVQGGLPTDLHLADQDDYGRDVLWEYVLAAICATYTTDVRREKPDLVCTFEGLRVAIAAKTPSTIARLNAPFAKGAAQIAQAADRVDCGIVALNLVRVIPANEWLSRAWEVNMHQEVLHHSRLNRWMYRLMHSDAAMRARAELRRHDAVAAVVYFAPALAMIRPGRSPGVASMYQLKWDFRDPPRGRLPMVFLDRLHEGFQHVHAFLDS